MSGGNPFRSGHFFTRWLVRPHARETLPWAVDRHEAGGGWIEFGRHASKREAQESVTRSVADGAGDRASFRVVKRPIYGAG
jgi:hypothetical protein